MKELFITNSITINATPEKVWKVLTEPAHTKKYMFGCETVSDWKKGSSLLWKGTHEGKDMIFVKGFILEIQPKVLLSYSVFDPNNKSMEDIPENYLAVTYLLQAHNNKSTNFTVKQGDYNKVAEGRKRYEESYNGGQGWMPILEQIKKLAEAGT